MPHYLLMARYFFLFLFIFIQPGYALDKLSVHIDQIVAEDWQLNGVSLSLFNLHNQTQQFTLSSKQLSLPEPFSDLKFFDIQCLSFTWKEGQIVCQQGKAKLKSRYFHSSPFNFSFFVSAKQSHFNFQGLKFAKGTVSLSAKEENGYWFVTINTKGMQLKKLFSLISNFELVIDDVSSGNSESDIKLTGNRNGLNKIWIKTQFKKVSLQANQGQIATEALNFKLDLIAKLNKGVWQWENNNQIQQGELYIDPVYLEIKDKALNLSSKGLLNKQGDIIIQQSTFSHADVLQITANGIIKQKQVLNVEKAQLSTNILDLEQFSLLYILPFSDQTAFSGIKISGQLRSELKIEQSAINEVVINFNNLTVADDKKRIAIDGLGGMLNWSLNQDDTSFSQLYWKKLTIKAIPIESGQLKFQLGNKNIHLLEPRSIPLLGGMLDIKQFKWQNTDKDEPKVFFEGGIRDVSLEQLTSALDWTELSGNISGYIPGVNYENKTLTFNGGLTVNLFDGMIKINKLASSGLFTDFPKLHMDMEIDNLDLLAITEKFQIGGMEGRVSGYINDLYLENWEPVTFYAWLGTPENDDSRHRISQKAVENIASIGSGGATNILSKGFLQFFDSFRYDRLGLGCYLYQGVCQLMGVEAAEQGYYLIKGGGLLSIDVIAYNPRVDWKVLVQRLSRISTTDEVIVE